VQTPVRPSPSPLFAQFLGAGAKPGAKRFWLVTICVCLVVLVIATRWQSTRTVNRVNVVGTKVLRQQEIADIVRLPVKAAQQAVLVREINTTDIEHLVEHHPFVKTATAFVGASDALTVQVTERTLIAFSMYRGKQYYVDSEGRLLPYRLTEVVLDLPVIVPVGRYTLDSTHLAPVVSTLALLRTLDARLYAMVSEVNVAADGDMTLHLTSFTAPVRLGVISNAGADNDTNSTDAKRKIARLSAFVQHSANIHHAYTAYRCIDVRWEHQVVTQ
jgi:cell division septal protein FtsQ